MMTSNRVLTAALLLTIFVTAVSIDACKSSTPAPPAPVPGGPGTGMVVNSDSIVTAKIQNITRQSTGYPWALDVLIQSTVDVETLPNPVKDSVGKVVTVVTDQDVASYKVNDVVTARIKFVGGTSVDVSVVISLYMYNIAATP